MDQVVIAFSTPFSLAVITLINPGEATGIIEHTGPAAPKYNTVESRVRTFQNWPPDLRQRPIDMAEAGFYHIVSRGGGGASSTPDKVTIAKITLTFEETNEQEWTSPLFINAGLLCSV